MPITMHQHPMPAGTIYFLRHGATEPNLAGLRCGGDLDVALTDAGRRQAEAAGEAVAAKGQPHWHLLCSDLQRTRETADIITAVLARRGIGSTLRVDPALRERRLGAWNLQSVALTQTALVAGVTPPGGEAADEFRARIAAAVHRLWPLPAEPLLLIGSKGVARVLGELCGLAGRLSLDNGVLMPFDLGAHGVRPTLPLTEAV